MSVRKRSTPAQGARLAVLDTITATLDDMITSVAAELAYLQHVRKAFSGVHSAINVMHVPVKKRSKHKKAAKSPERAPAAANLVEGTLSFDVYQSIMQAGEPVNRNTIAEKLNRKPQDVSNALTELRKRKLIERTSDARWHERK